MRLQARVVDTTVLGWPEGTVGEMDHRLLKAPTVKLRSARALAGDDIIYCVDLRIRLPNAGQPMTSAELHSVEHFLLEGLQRLLPENFVSIGVMGCRTGFYLILVNEGRSTTLCEVIEEIFQGILQAQEVPYARIDQCGEWENHTLEGSQAIAREALAARERWLEAI